MKNFQRIGRREFLRDSALGLGAGPWMAREALSPEGRSDTLPGGRASDSNGLKMQARFGSTDTVWIIREVQAGFQESLASRELARGLRNLGLAREPIQALTSDAQPGPSDSVFLLTVKKEDFKHPEASEIVREAAEGQPLRVRLTGATPQAVLYAVFDFLERQGAFFGLEGEVYPLDPATALNLPSPNQPWQAQPRFNTRGLLPWPDFLNCITVFNREEHRAYLEAMLRMRFNTLGIHVYSGAEQWTESFLSFEYAGVGHLAFTDTSATNRWGYIPERTSRFGMGSPDFFAGEVFGSEATTKATSCWEDQELAQQLWSESFRYAQKLGIRTGVGFEPYQIPDEIFRACPPEAHYVSPKPKLPGPRIDPESVAARDILEARLAQLLETYPTVDYVWLWEDEQMNWASQKENVPLSVTPFQQAHDFLKKHAPEKRLVISGWGGVVRHFAYFHTHLPEDVIFTSLNDNLGWDPVSEEFGKLGGRERWPIPWLEDDPAMWLPQFHVHRGAEDLDRAEKFGCQGLLGIHWRHRMMDADAGFQARRSWDGSLKPGDYFRRFAAVQARGPRADKLAETLERTDRDRLILCSFTGKIEKGHHEIHEFTGDYDEAFQFWNELPKTKHKRHGASSYEPPEEVKASQSAVARDVRGLADNASSAAEHERIDYFARYLEFLPPYSESWSLAVHLNYVLQQAQGLKKQGKTEGARQTVMTEGVPLWLKLAPLVRQALLGYQGAVSERNELGALASMHNKYERLALFRLRASIKEHLGDLPSEVESLFQELRKPDPNATPRVFVPTRPSLLATGEAVRVFAVAPGGQETSRATLFTRTGGSETWHAGPMDLAGRRTFVAELRAASGPSPLLDYYVEAEFVGPQGKARSTAPLEAPSRWYVVTLV
ncbi:MAG TPA: hypothetical protein VKM93_22435 [Terriglobia bacterium]|nr:hypothetical protein [Terriglobia bacterium]